MMHTPRTPRTPSLRHHRASGLAFVEFDGHRVYLGKSGAPESEQRYHQAVAEWIANGRRYIRAGERMLLAELCSCFCEHADRYYRHPDGTPTGHAARVVEVASRLSTLYGHVACTEFGPKALQAFRQTLIDGGLARNTINEYVSVVRRMYRWAVAEEMVPVSVYQALAAVSGLRAGRSGARETEPVRPVSEEDIEAVRARVSRPVRALIDLQLLTGARPGEVLRLRPVDIDTSEEVWCARLSRHKNAYRGKPRMIYFGPRAKAVLREFMHERGVQEFLFSPRESEQERHARAGTHRRTDQKPNPRRTDRVLGAYFRGDSYRKAIARACEQAGIPTWTPNRLRHTAATRIRKECNIEAAQAMLGHASLNTTEIYAEQNLALARDIAARLG